MALAQSTSTNSTLRSLELEACGHVVEWSEVEEEVCEAIAQSGYLCKLRIAHGRRYGDTTRLGLIKDSVTLDLGARTRDALLRNRCAADIAARLGKVCRLDEFPGSEARFKCVSFRLCLLFLWFPPQALPRHLKALVIGTPRAQASVSSCTHCSIRS